ncbi:hypothetical protein FGO68_gene9724 [Halteria grandinella]|uniref:Protein kinase domain-containing protein n=1 Tax=Halteria grandinella TaxID=5974 RepID=A0A8J8NK60_HALGN|nr:hypothetical protein FGO68_gene9724 [Halteria grandinella]
MVQQTAHYHILEQRPSDHYEVCIATKADEQRQLAEVRMPRVFAEGADLAREFAVMRAIGRHQNVIGLVEYNATAPIYMALQYPKAQSLFHYLVNLKAGGDLTERWCRFFFLRQIVGGVVQMGSRIWT